MTILSVFLGKVKARPFLFLIIALMTLSGCISGFSIVPIGQGKEIEPNALARLQSGSLSTVWYHGSDEDFHYFSHFVKLSTRYKVRRDALEWPEEFPTTEGRSVFAGDQLIQLIQ